MPSVFALPNGSQIGYEILGRQHLKKGIRPLVFVCGMYMCYGEWEPLSKALSRKRPVLLFDHRDFGSSIVKTSALEEFTTASLAADAISLIKHIGWKSVDFCGWSLGGIIVQQILISPSLPFAVGHAILASTAPHRPHTDPESVDFMTDLIIQSHQPEGSVTDAQKAKFMRQMAEMNHGKEWLKDPKNRAKFEQYLPTDATSRPLKIVARQAQSVTATDLRKSLPKISSAVPILVIHGKLDQAIHYAESAYILRGIAHARRVTVDPSRRIPGSVPTDQFGHMWFRLLDSDIWVGVIETFLGDVPTTTVKARL